MRSIRSFRFMFCLLTLLAVSFRSEATTLTFSIFTDSNKTAQLPISTFVPQSYGDNVTNFNPTVAFGANYYDYGPVGGFTPHVQVEYRYWHATDYTNSSSGVNGPSNGYLWGPDYDGLTNVIYNTYGPTWRLEIRLIPEPGYQVTLESFDAAGYLIDRGGETLNILKNANSFPSQVLWSAGPDGTVVFPGAGTNHTPNVSVTGGDTLSLIFGINGNSAVDNIVFSELQIPEPGSILWIGIGSLLLLLRRRTS